MRPTAAPMLTIAVLVLIGVLVLDAIVEVAARRARRREAEDDEHHRQLMRELRQQENP